MSESKTQQTNPIHVDARGSERLVVLTPEDEDRFVQTCQWVVEASKLGTSRDVMLREWYGLLSHVKKWAEQHASLLKQCLAMQRDDQIGIFVVPAKNQYDFELSDLLTELDLELAKQFQICRCDVFQMPEKPLDDLEHLTGSGQAILIYAEPIPA